MLALVANSESSYFLHYLNPLPDNEISDWTEFDPFPNNKFLDSSKLKEFADDNSKFDANSGKLSKMVENTVGKGEIALFPQCFQKTCTANM